eukprot:Rhum_TRINITY_DN4548_c0_g1::Rhum_TRINITY_DN4548_c0_g1_i1::g.14722::m.14722
MSRSDGVVVVVDPPATCQPPAADLQQAQAAMEAAAVAATLEARRDRHVWLKTPELSCFLWACERGPRHIPRDVARLVWEFLGVTCVHSTQDSRIETLSDMWRCVRSCKVCRAPISSEEGPFFC